MPKNTIEAELEARVESFVTDLSELIRQAALESVNQALGLSEAPARRKTSKKTAKRSTKRTKRAKSGKRVRRSTEDLEKLSAAFLKHVKAKPGLRLEEIGAGMRIDTKELKRPVQLLLEAKKIRTEGERRGTKYFAGGRRGKVAKKKVGKRKAMKRAA